MSTTRERFEALMVLKDEGIPTVVWMTPILPYINDREENILGILNYCKETKVKGVLCFGMGLTLRDGNREYFYSKLDKHFPRLKEVYIKEFGNNYILNSKNNKELMEVFHKFCKENRIEDNKDKIFSYLNEFESKNNQISFFN